MIVKPITGSHVRMCLNSQCNSNVPILFPLFFILHTIGLTYAHAYAHTFSQISKKYRDVIVCAPRQKYNW